MIQKILLVLFCVIFVSDYIYAPSDSDSETELWKLDPLPEILFINEYDRALLSPINSNKETRRGKSVLQSQGDPLEHYEPLYDENDGQSLLSSMREDTSSSHPDVTMYDILYLTRRETRNIVEKSTTQYKDCNLLSHRKMRKAGREAEYFQLCHRVLQQWTETKLQRLGQVGDAILLWMKTIQEIFTEGEITVTSFFEAQDLRNIEILEKKLVFAFEPENVFVNEYLKRAYSLGEGFCIHTFLEPMQDLREILRDEFKSWSNSPLRTIIFENNVLTFPSYFLLYAVTHLCSMFFRHPIEEELFFGSERIPLVPSPSRDDIDRRTYVLNELKNLREGLKQSSECKWEMYYRMRRINFELSLLNLNAENSQLLSQSFTLGQDLHDFCDARFVKMHNKLHNLTEIKIFMKTLSEAVKGMTELDGPLLNGLNLRSADSDFRKRILDSVISSAKTDFISRINFYLNGSSLCEPYVNVSEIFADQDIKLKIIEFYTSLYTIPRIRPTTISTPIKVFLHYLVCEAAQLLPMDHASKNLKLINKRKKERSNRSIGKSSRRTGRNDSIKDQIMTDARKENNELERLEAEIEQGRNRKKSRKDFWSSWNMKSFLTLPKSSFERCGARAYELTKSKTSFFDECSKVYDQWVRDKLAHLHLIGSSIRNWMETIKRFFVTRIMEVRNFFNREKRKETSFDSILLHASWSNNQFSQLLMHRAYALGDGLCLHLRLQPLSDLNLIFKNEISTEGSLLIAGIESLLITNNPYVPDFFLLYAVQHLCQENYEFPDQDHNLLDKFDLPTFPSLEQPEIDENRRNLKEMKENEYIKSEIAFFLQGNHDCSWDMHHRILRLNDAINKKSPDATERGQVRILTDGYVELCNSLLSADLTAQGQFSKMQKSLYIGFQETLRLKGPLIDNLNARGQSPFSEKFYNFSIRKTKESDFASKVHFYLNGSKFCDPPISTNVMFHEENHTMTIIELFNNLFKISEYRPPEETQILKFYLHYVACETAQILPIESEDPIWKTINRRIGAHVH